MRRCIWRGAAVLINGHLDPWNLRRPINASFLAVRLRLAGGDLRGALVIQALLLGLVSLLAARGVARVAGQLAGLTMFGGLFAFASQYVSVTLSEALGVILGTLAFTVLLEGVMARRNR